MKKKIRSYAKNFKKKGLNLKENKRFFAIFSIIFSFIILVSATLAWSSYSEWVRNHVQSDPETISVKITEKFEQGSVLSYENSTEKSVKIKNMSKRNAIVRVRFEESFLPLEIDVSDGENQGNGNLKEKIKETENIIKIDDVKTWRKGDLVSTGKTNKNGDKTYYIATDDIIIKNKYKGEENRVLNTEPSELSIFKWNFNPAIFSSPNINNLNPYWVFDGEYFYYSQVVNGGETTEIDLLQSVELLIKELPNKYKYALYDINIVAEGIEASENGLEFWGKETEYLDMYKLDPQFK